MADVDIDLYDTIEEDFNQDGDYNNGDLYDDVITASTQVKTAETKQEMQSAEGNNGSTVISNPMVGDGSNKPHTRRFSLYVSNMTWWTTDVDLIEACKAVGVNDVTEVKFYENRLNGQSKGFASVVTQTEVSMQNIMNNLKDKQIHSQKLITHPMNRMTLQMLDAAAGGSREQDSHSTHMNSPRFPSGPSGMRGPRPYIGGPRSAGPGIMGPRPNSMGPRGPMSGMRPGPRGPMGAMTGGQGMRSRAPMASHQDNESREPAAIPGSSYPPQSLAGGYSQAGAPAPVPHVNPAFFPGGQAPPAVVDPYRQPGAVLGFDAYGRPVDGQAVVNATVEAAPAAPQLSDTEFNDILTRNKSVSSSAISRAVQDASAGEYASAIETLVTAISLIKQSKISSDDRCKILIASLQDTKQGIEDKSYGSRSSGGSSRDRRERGYSHERDSRDRRRSRSRDRDHGRRRERSRSRDRRDYRDRSRDRDSRSGYYQSRDRYH